MNFNQLRYILAIDKFKNFTRAAEYCEIAQSTLSKEVQRLEKEFEIIIFDRSRTPVVPTHKGKELLKLALEVLHKADEFSVTARQTDNRPEGKFHLGVLSYLSPYLLPFLCKNFSDKYPGISLSITEVSLSEIDKMLFNNELDGAITLKFPKNSGYYETTLSTINFLIYTAKDHALFKKEKLRYEEIPFAELRLTNDLKKYFIKKNNITSAFPQKNNLKNLQFNHVSPETIRKIVDHQAGISIFPELIKNFLPTNELNKLKQVNHSSMNHSITFITPRYFEKEAIIKILRSEISKNIISYKHKNFSL